MSVGTLFTEDFLAEGVVASPAWSALSDAACEAARAAMRDVVAKVADPGRLNEAQTQHQVIEPLLALLGWSGCYSVQANLGAKGRSDVADYSLFADPAAFSAAERTAGHDAKLKHAVAVGDAKAWSVGLDEAGKGAGRGETPSAQILRYVMRAEIASDRRVRFGLLTNGRTWRLYYGGARSPLEGFYEADLPWLLGVPGAQGALEGGQDAAHRFKTFLLVFRREAFAPSPDLAGKTFHDHALVEGRLWETKVRTDLSQIVFKTVFPTLVFALASADPAAPATLDAAYLGVVREAALTMLYRLLFALYAEDRDLLPTRDRRFAAYSLSAMRDEVAVRIDQGAALSERASRYWETCSTLFRIVDEGDEALGTPAYNGGLFSRDRAPLLDRVRLGDAVFAPLLDALSRTQKAGRKVRINFRDLSVRELGAIYEGLLEFEPVATPAGIEVRPNAFSRKNTGSYYTPDELVALIIERTVGPLVDERIAAFDATALRFASDRRPVAERLAALAALDPATTILELKVCDPAMGSGHFLVALIDYLAPRVLNATGAAAAHVGFAPYVSPLLARLAAIRERIEGEATRHGWATRPDQLTDQNLVKRMVLKRCVYGVDKNPMAVELAKVALWLHTFTVGAPLSFLDHHLRCGDSLFGERVRPALDELQAQAGFFINNAVRAAEAGVAGMELVESLTDAAIAEVHASESAFADVETRTGPLARALDVWQGFKWYFPSNVRDRASNLPFVAERGLLAGILSGAFGDVFAILSGAAPPAPMLDGVTDAADLAGRTRRAAEAARFLAKVRALASQERFLHWQVAFPGVWRNWQSAEPDGGFDAVIGNPPWDRMKMQEVEWFAARAPTIARQPRAADRKRMIATLRREGDPLAADYDGASARAETAMERARRSGDYPLLSRGDINLYSIFVERAQALVSKDGIAGLLTPSGIASDLTASAFFKGVAAAGRVRCLFDFENRRGEGTDGARRQEFFPDVDSRFKFCAFVVGGTGRVGGAAECAFFLQDPPDRAPPEKLFRLGPADFALVNPNTGTAPIFRTRRDADLTTAIYRRLPVLVDRSSGEEVKAWPVRYLTMFHMTNDSHLFWTRERLEAHGAYPVALGRWRKGEEEEWVPLYEGKMVQAFDHRAAHIVMNAANVHRPAQPEPVTEAEHCNPHFAATSQYWTTVSTVGMFKTGSWSLGFKEITAPSNERTMIAALIPFSGVGNTLPLIIGKDANEASKWLATVNSLAFDFVARTKVQGQHLNWFIVEQLPVVPPAAYARRFGALDAGAIVRDHALRLTFTAWDLEPFARDMGYAGDPFRWDEDERRHLRARLDALYFHLYGIEDEADIRYILSTFPIVERKDRDAFEGVYLTAELVVWYLRALGAGDTTTDAPVATIIRIAKRAA